MFAFQSHWHCQYERRMKNEEKGERKWHWVIFFLLFLHSSFLICRVARFFLALDPDYFNIWGTNAILLNVFALSWNGGGCLLFAITWQRVINLNKKLTAAHINLLTIQWPGIILSIIMAFGSVIVLSLSNKYPDLISFVDIAFSVVALIVFMYLHTQYNVYFKIFCCYGSKITVSDANWQKCTLH